MKELLKKIRIAQINRDYLEELSYLNNLMKWSKVNEIL